MRKMREALTLVGLPSDMLLKHGNRRLVYGIPLAENFRRLLLGLETKPHYIIPQSDPYTKTSMIGAYWIHRWLSRRIEQDSVLSQVASNCLVHPIRHGAQVHMREEEMLSAMTAAVS